VNNSPRGGAYGPYGGANDGRQFDGTNFGDQQGPVNWTPVQAQQAYNDLMRDIGHLRGDVADDKDLTKEFQDLLRRAQEMDPRKWGNDPRLNAVIGSQALTQIDEVELMLRRKIEKKDGSVRSTSPRVIPPGYADAVAEYNKRLSKQ
jgi:hypothetical protein